MSEDECTCFLPQQSDPRAYQNHATVMINYKTEQEQFWAGAFGDNYIERNQDARFLAANSALFSKILGATRGVERVCEFGGKHWP